MSGRRPISLDPGPEARAERAEHLANILDDLVGALLYYDRKEDEDMPRYQIEAMIKAGETSADAMIERFAAALRKELAP